MEASLYDRCTEGAVGDNGMLGVYEPSEDIPERDAVDALRLMHSRVIMMLQMLDPEVIQVHMTEIWRMCRQVIMWSEVLDVQRCFQTVTME
jgi:hypothetical protein